MKKSILIFAAFFSSIITLASCSQNDNPAHRREAATERLLKKHKIKIAITGQWSTTNGEWISKGADLALEEINAEGGVLGAQVKLLRFDDNNKVSSGAEIAAKIVDDEQICAVLGHYSSSVSLFNSPIYHYYGLLMLTPFSTNSTLTKQGLPYILRNIPNNEAFAKNAVNLCDRKGWKRVMALYLNNSYCRELIDAFEQNCGTRAIIVPERIGYEEVYNLSDYTEIASKWKTKQSFDAIFIAGFLPQAAEIVSLFRSEGITQPIIGSIDFESDVFFSVGINKDENNFYCISNYDVDNTNAAFVDFKNNFKEKYDVEPNWEALGSYDALKVLVKAIGNAGSVKAKDITAALKKKEVWDEGAGPYHFNETGEIEKKLLVKKAEGGVFKTVNE